jgi:hypothetical protein
VPASIEDVLAFTRDASQEGKAMQAVIRERKRSENKGERVMEHLELVGFGTLLGKENGDFSLAKAKCLDSKSSLFAIAGQVDDPVTSLRKPSFFFRN